MRWQRLALIISVGLNLLLGGVVWSLISYRQQPACIRKTTEVVTAPAVMRTNVVVQRQFFHWRQLESEDYLQYVKNLRDVGCPESTIGDIIIGDVNQVFASRLAQELDRLESELIETGIENTKFRTPQEILSQLQQERHQLLTTLLGTNWVQLDQPWTNTLRPVIFPPTLEGEILGSLPKEAKIQVRRIYVDTWKRIQSHTREREQKGLPPDPATIASLESEMKAALSALLSPLQLDEFMLRYSLIGRKLQAKFDELKYFNVTDDELRRIFRAVYDIEEQLMKISNRSDPEAELLRRSLQARRDQAIRLALGPAKYEQYVRLQDPLYSGALELAKNAGIPSSAELIYQLLQAYREEYALLTNQSLPREQRTIKGLELQLELAKALAIATGKDIPIEPPRPQEPIKIAHRVEPGETIDKLQARYGISLRELLQANPGLDLTRIKPGDTIFIPLPQPETTHQ